MDRSDGSKMAPSILAITLLFLFPTISPNSSTFISPTINGAPSGSTDLTATAESIALVAAAVSPPLFPFEVLTGRRSLERDLPKSEQKLLDWGTGLTQDAAVRRGRALAHQVICKLKLLIMFPVSFLVH